MMEAENTNYTVHARSWETSIAGFFYFYLTDEDGDYLTDESGNRLIAYTNGYAQPRLAGDTNYTVHAED